MCTGAKSNRRQALTLIELVVVLVILVALAGILIPMLPSMLGRAHTSSGATNLSEINKFVQTYEQLQQEYPKDLDNLGAGTAPVDYMPGVDLGGQLTARALVTEEAAALVNAGITRVADLWETRATLPATATVTFNPYKGTFTTITTATPPTVAFLDEAAVENTIVRDDPINVGDVYVVFGLGRASSMIGKVITDPPVHFGEGNDSNAANVYSRFGLVFRVTRGSAGTPTPLDRAIYVGSVSFHPDGIVGSDGHLEEYYNLTKAQ